MSAIQDSVETAVTAQAAQPTQFFLLPGELRDQIYDILHQHEESTRFHSLTFRYPKPLSHLRLVNRQFKAEYDKRTPAVSRLTISQTSRNQLWYQESQPFGLPRTVTRRIAISCKDVFREIEVNFDVCDTYHEPTSRLRYFGRYLHWLSICLRCNKELVTPARGGQLHLRLFFNYVSNLERIQNEDSVFDWSREFYTKISLVYDGDKLARGQTVATRSKGSDWETDETFIEQGRVEWAIGRLQADQVAVSE